MRPLTLTAPPTFRASRFQCVTINTVRRFDPTHTGQIRARFEAEIRRRFAALIRQLRKALPEMLDALPMMAANADGSVFTEIAFGPGGRFMYPRSAENAADFMRWLRGQARRQVLGISEGASVESAAARAWSSTYIDTAYQRGIRQSGQNLRRGGAKVEESWIRGAFNRPVHADRVGLIYSRTFTELEHVTDVMARQMAETLALGMAEWRNPLDIADALVDRVEHIGITRARTIARTEVIASHAEATLNAYEEAGVAGVEVEAEWSTAGDDRVCQECESMEGRLFTLDEARGMIPAHPNCRCAFLPRVINGSGIVLNWKRHAPRNATAQRRGSRSPGAVPGPHAHHCACGHRGGGGAQRGAGSS